MIEELFFIMKLNGYVSILQIIFFWENYRILYHMIECFYCIEVIATLCSDIYIYIYRQLIRLNSEFTIGRDFMIMK